MWLLFALLAPVQQRRGGRVMLMPVVGESIVAAVTPMDEENNVDLKGMRDLLEWQLAEGSKGFVVLGTTGEASTLSAGEREAVIREAADVLDQRAPMIVGTGGIDTAATIAASQRAAELGADAVLVVTPYYVKPPQRGLIDHFTAIADASDAPIILYNVPGRTAVDMTTETVAALAEHPNIIGIKDATGDVARVGPMREACGDDFVLVSGDDATSLDYVAAGGNGVISVTANIAPRYMQQTMTLGTTDLPAARDIDDGKLSLLHADLFCEANPIPIKWALHRAGRIGPGIRLPLATLAPDFHSRLDAAMAKADVAIE